VDTAARVAPAVRTAAVAVPAQPVVATEVVAEAPVEAPAAVPTEVVAEAPVDRAQVAQVVGAGGPLAEAAAITSAQPARAKRSRNQGHPGNVETSR